MDSDHSFIASETPEESRSPCPGLNTLANHGYIPRSGKDIDFKTVLHAITSVYNFSYPFALSLAIPGFLIYGKLTTNSSVLPWNWNITIDLASLSKFGALKVAHKASLVHPDFPSHSPDPTLVNDMISHAHKEVGDSEPGLTLRDIATIRVEREARLDKPLGMVYETFGQGEGAMVYLALRNSNGTIPTSRLAQWLGDERLPDKWWEGVRPPQTVGLMDRHRISNEVREIMAVVRASGSRS